MTGSKVAVVPWQSLFVLQHNGWDKLCDTGSTHFISLIAGCVYSLASPVFATKFVTEEEARRFAKAHGPVLSFDGFGGFSFSAN